MDFIGDATLVSHGASSDVSFLKHYSMLFLEKKFNNNFLCTHLLTQSVFPKLKNKTLSGVADFFKIDLNKVHNARDDASITYKIFWKILDELKLKKNAFHLEDLLKLQGDRESINLIINAMNLPKLQETQEEPSVFYYLNSANELLFSRASQNSKQDLKNLLYGSKNKFLNKILAHSSTLQLSSKDSFLEALEEEKTVIVRSKKLLNPYLIESRNSDYIQIPIGFEFVQKLKECPIISPYIEKIPPMKNEEFNQHRISHELQSLRKQELKDVKSSIFGPISEKMPFFMGYCMIFGPYKNAKQKLKVLKDVLQVLKLYKIESLSPAKFMSFKFFLNYFFNVPLDKHKNPIKRLFYFFKTLYIRNSLQRLCHKTFLIPASKSGLIFEKNTKKIIAYDIRNSSHVEKFEVLNALNNKSLTLKSFSNFKSKCFKKTKEPPNLITYLNRQKLTQIQYLDYAVKLKNVKFLSYKNKSKKFLK